MTQISQKAQKAQKNQKEHKREKGSKEPKRSKEAQNAQKSPKDHNLLFFCRHESASSAAQDNFCPFSGNVFDELPRDVFGLAGGVALLNGHVALPGSVGGPGVQRRRRGVRHPGRGHDAWNPAARCLSKTWTTSLRSRSL